MSSDDFHAKVIERSWTRDRVMTKSAPNAVTRSAASKRSFHPAALGTDQAGVQLFSKWEPSRNLLAKVKDTGTGIIHHPLGSIPQEDLEANRAYHVWSGTPLQAESFQIRVGAGKAS